MTRRRVSPRDLKTFYDPHPGLAGALMPIPYAVKQVANELNGKTLSLQKAVERIQAVTDGIVRAETEHNYIRLIVGPHHYRVIRYR